MKSDEEDAIFQLACALEGDDLEHLLVTACADSPQLRERMEQRLADEKAAAEATVLDARLSTTGPIVIGESPGSRIGPYKLVEKLGEGGMGVVWRATQDKGMKRMVALKIIKAGMDSADVIARFEAERQALALMDHPNIAKVYDAGATESGRPYFVMELVKGTPITRYCDAHRMKPEARLRLFIEVCNGLQHAHQKGVIHRDIKPGNILVAEHDKKPVPKLIDFGIAKATDQELTERTLFTQMGQVMGTPVYMSPEQAAGHMKKVDTRTDVYALGVLLYELLTGSTPIDAKELKQAGYAEMARLVAEAEPQRPSLRVTVMSDRIDKVAAGRGINPPTKLGRLIRGDLDWIVMRALEKEPDRRYVTVRGFALDIERYLNSEPVEACPPSTAYRLRKFMRRNRALMRAAAVVAAVILCAVLVDLRGQAKRKGERAEILFTTLFDTRADRLPSVVQDVRDHRGYLEQRLGQAANDESLEPRDRARANLVLLLEGKPRMPEITPWLLKAEPAELGAFMDMLGDHQKELSKAALEILADEQALPEQRLRAAAICAEVASENPTLDRWTSEISAWLVNRSAFKAERWIRILEPIKGALNDPLDRIFAGDPDTPAGEVAALALATYHENDLTHLIDLARRASTAQLKPISTVLAVEPRRAKEALTAELNSSIRSDLERARLAMVLLQMNEPAAVWTLLKKDPPPDLRSGIIHSLASFQVDWRILASALESEQNPELLSAIILALGDYSLGQISAPQRSKLRTGRLEKLYVAHPHPAVRSATQWLIGEWLRKDGNPQEDLAENFEEVFASDLRQHLKALDLQHQNLTGKPVDSKEWYATPNGDFTMAVIRGPKTFMMGSSDPEADSQRITLEHSFAIATTEVTRELYERFLVECPGAQDRLSLNKRASLSAKRDGYERHHTASAITYANLWEASLFCWWFSQEQGIPPEEQCYQYDPETQVLRMRDEWLKLGGYRLPTEAEWEYACRAGTSAPRFFGSNPELIAKYAWCAQDDGERKISRPGLLRPNPLGLFDILGNGAELCQEFYKEIYIPQPRGSSFEIPLRFNRSYPELAPIRGGSFYTIPTVVTSGARHHDDHNQITADISFRLARTVEGQ